MSEVDLYLLLALSPIDKPKITPTKNKNKINEKQPNNNHHRP